MAKSKLPLLSFGATGTIAKSLTFQKRGRDTIARTKPIPKDPKSEAQLAQRQKYKDAVALWNALSPQEQEAWRGVCPGLTAFQCFLSSELKKVPPPPPPEEYTEEQTDSNSDVSIVGVNAPTCGQLLFIPNRKVTKLGFLLRKQGSPTGDVLFTIRNASDKSLILSKVWGDASVVPAPLTYLEVEFDDPTIIDLEVRCLIEHPDYAADDFLISRLQQSDVKPDECWTRGSIADPVDMLTWDFVYRYKYYEV